METTLTIPAGGSSAPIASTAGLLITVLANQVVTVKAVHTHASNCVPIGKTQNTNDAVVCIAVSSTFRIQNDSKTEVALVTVNA